jgi:hypothetical protein
MMGHVGKYGLGSQFEKHVDTKVTAYFYSVSCVLGVHVIMGL